MALCREISDALTQNIDDIHCYDSRFVKALNNIETLDIGDRNKKLIREFVRGCRRQDLKKSTITNYLNLFFRMIANLRELRYTGDIDTLDDATFDDLMIYLEDVKKVSRGEIRNYKKFTKKFFRTICDDEDDIPRWVRGLKLGTIETQVQPSDIHTPEEIEKLLDACRHPRNKAMIAVLFDGGMRIGALASCRIKNVEFNKFGSILYISNTSRCKKTAQAKGIPLTWSTGFLNQWMSVHPLKDDPEAPLWVSLNKNMEPISYKTIRETLKQIGKNANVNKPLNPHAFRHTAITKWILDGLNDQAIKHRAAWSRGSTQMMKVYANFTDQEMNNLIYEKYGLEKEEKQSIQLQKCPRCYNVLRKTDKICSQCGLVLDCRDLEEIKENEATASELLQFLLNNEAGQKILDMLKNK